MASELKLSGPIVVGNLSSDPATGYEGEIYYNTTSNELRQFSGGSWSAIGSGSVNAINQLTGDVTAGPASGSESVAATVALVGGQTAAAVASAAVAVAAAASIDTPSTLVERDSSGNFSAGTITASLTGNVTGNVSGSSATFTSALAGDITGNQGTTNVAKIQGTTVSGTTGSTDVVFSASPTLTGTITAAAANFSGSLGANDGITSSSSLAIDVNSGASSLEIESLNVQRSVDGTNFITETYVDSTTLVDNSGPTTVSSFSFSSSSFAGVEISYVIETGQTPINVRMGTLRVVSNGTTNSENDMFSETADCGVSWSATLSGGTVEVQYTASNQGFNRTMRADVKSFRL